jgi:hypothetical protein
MLVSDFVRVLDLAVGPAILVSGIGLLLLSMTNRFGRVIDRARVLVPRMAADHGDGAGRIAAQLKILARRARVLRAAITMAVSSLLLTVLLVVGLFAASACQCDTHWMAVSLTACFTVSMISLIVALVLFLYELNLSLNALWLEMPAKFRR